MSAGPEKMPALPEIGSRKALIATALLGAAIFVLYLGTVPSPETDRAPGDAARQGVLIALREAPEAIEAKAAPEAVAPVAAAPAIVAQEFAAIPAPQRNPWLIGVPSPTRVAAAQPSAPIADDGWARRYDARVPPTFDRWRPPPPPPALFERVDYRRYAPPAAWDAREAYDRLAEIPDMPLGLGRDAFYAAADMANALTPGYGDPRFMPPGY